MHLYRSSESEMNATNDKGDKDDENEDDSITEDENETYEKTVKHLERLSNTVALFCRIIDAFHVFLTDRVERSLKEKEEIYKKTAAKTITQLEDLLNWISAVHLTNNGTASVQFEYKSDFTDTNLFSSLMDAHIETIWRKLIQESKETRDALRTKVQKMEPVDDFFKPATTTTTTTTTDAPRSKEDKDVDKEDDNVDIEGGVMVDLYLIFGALLESIAISKTIYLIYHRLVRECGQVVNDKDDNNDNYDDDKETDNDDDTIQKKIVKKVERSLRESDYRVTKTSVTRLEPDKETDDSYFGYSEKTVKMCETREKNAAHLPKLLFITDTDAKDVDVVRKKIDVNASFCDRFCERMRAIHDQIIASQRIRDDRSLIERSCAHYARMIQIDALNRLTRIPLYYHHHQNQDSSDTHQQRRETITSTASNRHHVAFSLCFLKYETRRNQQQQQQSCRHIGDVEDKKPFLCVLHDGMDAFKDDADFFLSDYDRTAFKKRFKNAKDDIGGSRYRSESEKMDREDGITELQRCFYSEHDDDRRHLFSENGDGFVRYLTPVYRIFEKCDATRLEASTGRVQLFQTWYASSTTVNERIAKNDTYHAYQLKSLIHDLKRWLTNDDNIIFYLNDESQINT
jgi:hypothetical protein